MSEPGRHKVSSRKSRGERRNCGWPAELSLHTGRNPGEVLNNDRDDCLNVRNFVPILFGGLLFLSALLATAYTSRSRLAWKVMLDILRIINQSVVLL
jgi:hypothetical protein